MMVQGKLHIFHLYKEATRKMMVKLTPARRSMTATKRRLVLI